MNQIRHSYTIEVSVTCAHGRKCPDAENIIRKASKQMVIDLAKYSPRIDVTSTCAFGATWDVMNGGDYV